MKKKNSKIQLLKDIRLVHKSKQFDKKYYLRTNTDIKGKYRLFPSLHYVLHGWDERRKPNEFFSIREYLTFFEDEKKAINPIFFLEHHMSKNEYKNVKKHPVSVDVVLNQFLPSQALPLNSYYSKNKTIHRLNLVCWGFAESDIFGGKATAIILAILFVNKYNYTLRVIANGPDQAVIYKVCKNFNLTPPKSIEYFDTNLNGSIDITDNDHFIPTMWLCADQLLKTPCICGKIFPLIQEVENFFYDHGDFNLRSKLVLSNDRLYPIINSKLLYDYLISDGYTNIRDNGVYFEPVFSKHMYKPSKNSFEKKEHYNLFFYGRPSHQRNLYYFGLECLERAFAEGVLDPKEWTVYIAGDSSVQEFSFSGNPEIIRNGTMKWQEYCKMMGKMDLCFSMMYTPHPSYPPLDAVSSGCVTVTNRYLNKNDLSNYSKNIVMGDLNYDGIIDAIKRGSELAKNNKLRKENYLCTNTFGEWPEALEPVLCFMKKAIDSK